MATTETKSFRATLERGTRLNWLVVQVPLDVFKVWGTCGRLPIKGEINGFAFRSSLLPVSDGRHILPVNKRMQSGARVSAGAVARFRLQPDTEPRVATVPAELSRFLSQDRLLKRWYPGLNYSTRKAIGDWITDVKSAEARCRRAEQIAERLLAVMEAERELPPILQVAFARDPRARRGWELMSPSHRRMHLLAMFYYREPEARARRVAKAVEDAVKYAARNTRIGDGRL